MKLRVGGARRPAAEVVATEPPVAEVGLALGRVGARADEHAVDVQPHPGRAHRRGDLVPLVVVVGGGAVDRARRVVLRADPEEDPPGAVHVDVPVTVAGVAVLEVAEAEQAPAALVGRQRTEVRNHSWVVKVSGAVSVPHWQPAVAAQLPAKTRLQSLSVSAAALSPPTMAPGWPQVTPVSAAAVGDADQRPARGRGGAVGDRRARRLVQRPVDAGAVVADRGRVGVGPRRGGRHGDGRAAAEDLVAVGVADDDLVARACPVVSPVSTKPSMRQGPPVRGGGRRVRRCVPLRVTRYVRTRLSRS